MVLREENFASMRINWNDKVLNMKEIANELNIGVDSMVFLDDDPGNNTAPDLIFTGSTFLGYSFFKKRFAVGLECAKINVLLPIVTLFSIFIMGRKYRNLID